MKFLVVFSCVLAVALAKPGHLLHSAAIIVPGAPIGADGRVVDTPEVSLAKAEHAAAHINEKITLNNEALRSADYVVAAHAAVPVAHAAVPVAHAAVPVAHAAPVLAAGPAVPYAHHAGVIGIDGRPLDTAAVAIAKSAHAAAHINEKINLHNEALRSADYVVAAHAAVPVAHAVHPVAHAVHPVAHAVHPVAYAAPVPYADQAGVIGIDGRPLDTAQVAIAKAAHAAAHINERVVHAQEASRNAFYY